MTPKRFLRDFGAGVLRYLDTIVRKWPMWGEFDPHLRAPVGRADVALPVRNFSFTPEPS
jgi:hypothetical protein